MVSPIGEEVHPSLSPPTSDSIRTWRDPAALTEALRSLDPLSYLRLAYGFIYPPPVVDSLISAYRLSSIRHFEAGWKTFQRWLPEDTVEITNPVFLSFLVSLKISSSRTTRRYPMETLNDSSRHNLQSIKQTRNSSFNHKPFFG